jgi:Ni/Fe-hydrogenase subunit HybB-like protein
MFESFIVYMLTIVGLCAILMGIGFVIASQLEYQSRLKSSVDDCQKQFKELRELLQQSKEE